MGKYYFQFFASSLYKLLILFAAFSNLNLQAQVFNYSDSWGLEGFSVETESASGVKLNFSIHQFEMENVDVSGITMKTVHLPGVFLPNDEGAPDLAGTSRFIAIPEGAKASFRVTSFRTESFENVDIAPAFRIPKGNEDGPLSYIKDEKIYNVDAFYPAEPVIISEPTEIRGVDVVQLGITPFQYNPVTKELIVYRDIKVEVDFIGGNGHFGEDRLRSRWFDPILDNILINFKSLPGVDYKFQSESLTDDFEYIIICPNDPTFLAWADSIKQFRTLQGIRTGIVTTTQIGGNNATLIENYINNAYNTWNIPPVAVLFLGDYGTTGNTVHSPTWNSYCISDHIYADVNGNNMADIITARMTAQNATHLQTMIGKFLGYERTPPTNPNYYNKPITAMGWQTERWFQICSESINGFWQNQLGKTPVRENAIYSGTPPFSIWSTATNTNQVVSYFGPGGRGYIPASPSYLTDWGGNATRINNDINSGAFMLQHRDHGAETGWGEPDYGNSNLSGLNNNDLVYVMSINCLTGKFNWSGECFAEAFHRHQKGAFGIIAATEVSYSFVNDAYVWGMYDGMWPNFMPDYGVAGPDKILPAFGNVYGKYFLQYSNWPYNTSDKMVTYYLFHHHGDAFSTVYSEMPQNLTVIHDPVIVSGQPQFVVTADNYSLISLTLNGEIIGVAEGTGAPVVINIPFIVPANTVVLTVTKQNYYRYSANIPVVPATGAYVVADSCIINDASGNSNGLLDYGESPLLSIRVRNVGVADANNVNVTLRSTDSYISITDSTEFYGNISAGAQKLISNGFAVTLNPLVPDGHLIPFTVVANDGVNNWLSNFSLKAYSPLLAMGSFSVSDPLGNNNNALDPGETADVLIEIKNNGSSGAVSVAGELISSDQYITINSATQTYGNIGQNSSVIKSFSVTAAGNTPTGHSANFNFNITASPGLTSSGSFYLIVGQIPALVLCLDENHNSSPAIKAALDSNNIAYDYSMTLPADLNLYKSIFVCLGIYSNNYVLSSTDGQTLANYLNNGGMIYMEGGDTWYYDTQTPVHPMFNITGVSDGSGDLGTILGQNGTITQGMTFTYSGENSWIDRITNIPPAVTIFRNQSPDYGCAVAYNAGNYKTIGASFEFGGLNNGTAPSNRKVLMQKIIEFFGLGIIPVELVSFNAEVEQNVIVLKWETATETNNQAFMIERSSDNFNFEKIGEIEGKGTTTEKQEYIFRDASISSGKGKVYYRLRQIDFDGTENLSDVIEVDYSMIPKVFNLSQNYPNPFNPMTTIRFDIPKEVKVTLKMYDMLGAEVETLIDEVMEPGYYKYEWNASKFASGVYFYRITAGNFVSAKKLILLR
ncbi:MAG: T9SS type A sorting domain-containing protein [Ignavibacteriaceae bacterium]|nr:T9SS type A sorting domain-containing protein [Ignavibacteriaceae bacterium]